jgi:predicted ester cyclase
MEDGTVAMASPHLHHPAEAVMAPLDVVTATIAAYNDQDLDRLAELHDPSARIKFAGVDGDIGLEAWMASLTVLFTILPDFTISPLTVLADEHAAMLEVDLTGTNSGEIPLRDDDQKFLGVDVDRLPPTGRLVEVTGVVVLRTEDGRIVRETHHWPRSWLDEALGLVTVDVRPVSQGARRARMFSRT